MTLENCGFKEIEFVPKGGTDADLFTARDVIAGGTLSRPELIMRLIFPKALEKEGEIVHRSGNIVVAHQKIEVGVTDWATELYMGRGVNTIEFRRFGEEDLTLQIFHRTTLAEIFDGLIKALILLVLVQTFIVQTYRIPSSSMEDTFKPGDYVLVEKLTFVNRRPDVGDIVVFRYPRDFRKEFVKRVIARADEEVILQDKVLFVDGKEIKEPFASYREWLPYSGGDRNREVGPLYVPKKHVFVMGDNRDNSLDSREWGPLSLHYISGRPWMIYWPPGRMGLVKHGRKRKRENKSPASGQVLSPSKGRN